MRDYLKWANIYKGDAIKKKTDLIEMIIYSCTTNKFDKENIVDITTKHSNQLLKRNGIILRSLPGYGKAGLKKKIWSLLNMIVGVIIKSLALEWVINNYSSHVRLLK